MRRVLWFAVPSLCLAGPLAAQQDTTELARLRAQVEAVTRELERLTLGAEVVPAADTAMLGFGPAASKVYRVGQGVSLGGYGEVVFDRFAARRQDDAPSGLTNQIDALRAIVYVGYKFGDRFVFNSEIELEHGGTDQTGSVSLEFAYLDYRLRPELGLRGGLLLVPMGWINELHEPPVFLGARRPETEQRIIPTTWRENGLGAFGSVGPVSYRAYLINGLDGVGGGSANASGFSSAGLRGGRQKGSRAVAEDWAGVARVDLTPAAGVTVGASGYLGQSGQNNAAATAGQTIGARTLIAEGHAEYRARGLWLRGLAAIASLDDVEELNVARGLTGAASIGERLVGWYVEAGYDVLRFARTSHTLMPYARYEMLDTQDRVPAGFTADPANDQEIVTLGVAWKPLPQIALKGDYQIRRNEAETGVNQLSVALGYLF